MGRPTKYTPELAAEICERLAAGESLRAICRDGSMPSTSMVMRWSLQIGEFREQYAHARELGFDAMADEVIEIADEEPGTLENGATDGGEVANKRLRFDARRWYLSKLAPKKYGERTAMELTGANGGPVEINDADRAARLAGLLALAQQRKNGDVSDLV